MHVQVTFLAWSHMGCTIMAAVIPAAATATCANKSGQQKCHLHGGHHDAPSHRWTDSWQVTAAIAMLRM